jgi:amidase
VRSVLKSAVTDLRNAGGRIVGPPPVTLRETVGWHMELLDPLMERSSTLLHRAWLSANERREQLRAAMAAFLVDVDVLLMPVAEVPAIRTTTASLLASRVIRTAGGSRHYLDLFGWASLATVAYLPATVVPVGRTSTGLPVGIQGVGPHLEDRATLTVARHVEGLLGGFVPPPGF